MESMEGWRGDKRRNKEEMKKQFFGKEKNGTMGGCVKRREKSSEVISKSCQRRQPTGRVRKTHRIERGYRQVVESDSKAKPGRIYR